jgi:hypothetical protein
MKSIHDMSGPKLGRGPMIDYASEFRPAEEFTETGSGYPIQHLGD